MLLITYDYVKRETPQTNAVYIVCRAMANCQSSHCEVAARSRFGIFMINGLPSAVRAKLLAFMAEDYDGRTPEETVAFLIENSLRTTHSWGPYINVVYDARLHHMPPFCMFKTEPFKIPMFSEDAVVQYDTGLECIKFGHLDEIVQFVRREPVDAHRTPARGSRAGRKK